MMGIFNGYLRPGKGVSKEEAEKRDYFGTIKERFGEMVKLNLIYVACLIPFIALSYILTLNFWSTESIEHYAEQLLYGNITVVFWIMIPLSPFILSGPFTAGLTYITKEIVHRNPVFLWSDFLEKTKGNIKQAIVANIFLYLQFMIYLSVLAYYVLMSGNVIIIAILIVVGIMLLSMAYYVFPMIVSFEMKIFDIFKTAWSLASSRLLQNLFFTLIFAVIHVASVGVYGGKISLIWLVLAIVFLISWTSYTMNYYVWNVLEKYIPSEDSQEIEEENQEEVEQSKEE